MKRLLSALGVLLAIGLTGTSSASPYLLSRSFTNPCTGHLPACTATYWGTADANLNYWAGYHASQINCGYVSTAWDYALATFGNEYLWTCEYATVFSTSLRTYVSGSPCAMSSGIRLAEVIPETEFNVCGDEMAVVDGHPSISLSCITSPKYKAVYDTDMVVGGPFYDETNL